MLGVIYLLLAVLLGKEITEGLLLHGRSGTEEGNRLWLVLPAAFGVGVLLLTWVVYAVSWAMSVCAGAEHPLFYGNLIGMGLTAAGLAAVLYRRLKSAQRTEAQDMPGGRNFMGVLWGNGWHTLVRDRKLFRKELVFFGALLVFFTWVMFFVFHIYNGYLYSGFTVYGDYAPHTAMMRSFSWGNNFPTQYPHYGGADVKYHFMFQFLSGNLEYLGLRMDIAYNSVSVFSLLGFVMLIYQLARRIVGGFAAGVAAAGLFLFRSGLAFFRFAAEHLAAGDLWKTLSENTNFIGYTANEDWGLWNFNVYLNQRHLAFGLLLAALAVWVYLDWLWAGADHREKGLRWFWDRLFTKQAWRSRSLDTALLLGMLLGLTSFWNGAAVIGGLLILMGFGLFSDGKLDYAVTAAVAVFFSLLQSRIFISGEAMNPAFYWGFLAEDKSVAGVLWYIVQVSGIYFLGLLVLVFFLRRRQRVVLAGFLFPAVFAFFVSLTPDINVNHKYVMISYGFLTIFWAYAAVRLFCGRSTGGYGMGSDAADGYEGGEAKGGLCLAGSGADGHGRSGAIRRPGVVRRAAAVLLVLCLTVTGIYDFVVILKDNDENHRVAVNMESSLSRWLSDNLDSRDLLLTPQYSINEVTMSGVMLYCGWPYYAWSAGYDTNYRAARAVDIYTTPNADVLKQTVEKEKITYILFEENMEFEQQKCREDIIAQTYPMVYNSEDGRIRIYET